MADRRPIAVPEAAADCSADLDVRATIAAELGHYRRARRAGDFDAAWKHLERSHILAQPSMGLHMASHVEMLKFALIRRDVRETAGQLFRIALVPLGALTGRLPIGNTGRARVSAFTPMPVPEDLRALVKAEAP